MNANQDNVVDAYYDDQLSPEESLEYRSHLEDSPASSETLRDYRAISATLRELRQREETWGEGISLWPEIRTRLMESDRSDRPIKTRKGLFLLRRPTWIGLALSAAAALILFFSGILMPEKLPANYCRIDTISSPDNNYMIYQDKSDGLTIIWIME